MPTTDMERTIGVHRELKAAGVEKVSGPRVTDYGMREVTLIDPDNNLIVFGARAGQAQS
jgi:hypothetical protein